MGRFLTVVLVALSVPVAATAAGSRSSSRPPASVSTPASDYELAVAAVRSREYARALSLLEKVVRAEPNNADAWNYMGFSRRNLKQFDQALSAYQRALAINPNHLGANEYLGELYVQTDQPGKAQEILRKLDSLCPAGCKEYDDLKKAIALQKK